MDQPPLARPRQPESHARRLRITQVGDATDTSPYPDPHPATGITTQSYIANMTRLIGALQGR